MRVEDCSISEKGSRRTNSPEKWVNDKFEEIKDLPDEEDEEV